MDALWPGMNAKRIGIGSHVVFTDDAVGLGYPANRIYEVTDSRIQNRVYTFSLTPVQVPAALSCEFSGIFAEDVRPVG